MHLQPVKLLNFKDLPCSEADGLLLAAAKNPDANNIKAAVDVVKKILTKSL
jgi:hypothetical protein